MPWYQTAARAPTSWLVIKTTLHLAIIWTLGLYLLPRFVITWQSAMALHAFFFEPQQSLALAMMAVATVISFWSAMLLAVTGRGTPARIDAPRRLVISGPYAWVRNPMVLCGLVQGTAVALYTGSSLILILVLVAGLLWHLVRRHDEERDLQRVFGRAYELYRRSVRCWMPRRSRWAPAEPEAAIAVQSLRATTLGRRRSHHRR